MLVLICSHSLRLSTLRETLSSCKHIKFSYPRHLPVFCEAERTFVCLDSPFFLSFLLAEQGLLSCQNSKHYLFCLCGVGDYCLANIASYSYARIQFFSCLGGAKIPSAERSEHTCSHTHARIPLLSVFCRARDECLAKFPYACIHLFCLCGGGGEDYCLTSISSSW
jgi:hypothetical protein